jgi:hypothetical protein
LGFFANNGPLQVGTGLVVIYAEDTIVTTRQALIAGGIVGLGISCAVLALLRFGVAGVLRGGRVDLMYVFWPSSVMLVRGWCCTLPGIMITASSVVINCLLYMALAYALWLVVGLVRTKRR